MLVLSLPPPSLPSRSYNNRVYSYVAATIAVVDQSLGEITGMSRAQVGMLKCLMSRSNA